MAAGDAALSVVSYGAARRYRTKKKGPPGWGFGRHSEIRAPIATGCRNGSKGVLDRDPGSGPESRLWAGRRQASAGARTAWPDGDVPRDIHEFGLCVNGRSEFECDLGSYPSSRAQPFGARDIDGISRSYQCVSRLPSGGAGSGDSADFLLSMERIHRLSHRLLLPAGCVVETGHHPEGEPCQRALRRAVPSSEGSSIEGSPS
jgi:hypothetical protein